MWPIKTISASCTHKGKGKYKCTKCNIEGEIKHEEGQFILHIDSKEHGHEAPPQGEDTPVYIQIKTKAFDFIQKNHAKYDHSAKQATEDFWNEYIITVEEHEKEKYTRIFNYSII